MGGKLDQDLVGIDRDQRLANPDRDRAQPR